MAQIDAPTAAGGPYYLETRHTLRYNRPKMHVTVQRRGQSPIPVAGETQDDLCVWEVGAESPWLDLSDEYIVTGCTWHDEP